MSLLLAYVGPGAGFTFLGSFAGLLASLVLGCVSFLLWPFRAGIAWMRRGRGYRKARIRRLIFLGLDGLDPGLTERYMAEGRLPNLSRLKEQGSFHRLRTTFPALSPVAWSTFATGVHPARHNIFDFLNRSLKSYVPELSSSRVRPARRVLEAGPPAHSIKPAGDRNAPQEPDVLEDSRGAQYSQHHPARAHHVSAREVRGADAFGDVHAGPARHAGQFLAVHGESGRGRARRRRLLSSEARRGVALGNARRAAGRIPRCRRVARDSVPRAQARIGDRAGDRWPAVPACARPILAVAAAGISRRAGRARYGASCAYW